MPTVPLGENPYLYQEGPTVPLRQQKTGGYAANTFGNRVFYTPEGSLPNSTLAPGLAPTPGQLLRQNLSGAGLAGAAIGGALQSQAAYSQGAGLFEGLGSGLGATAGAIGGQAAGAAAGASIGGAAGSALPGVGNVAGAGAGTVAGTIGGGLAGGAVGGSVGGGIGRAVDDFFWPDPAEPGIGIPPQPGSASPRPGGSGYPGQTPANAGGAGPIVIPEIPPPFTGGQMDGIVYTVNFTTGNYPTAGTGEVRVWGPFGGMRMEPSGFDTSGNPNGFSHQALSRGVWFVGGNSPTIGAYAWRTITSAGLPNPTVSVNFVTRPGGQPDTGGNLPTPREEESAPNPARPPSQPLPPRSSGAPSRSPDRPWPEREAAPVPDVDPFGEAAPFKAPEVAPDFFPTPNPLTPTDPLTPTPTQPRPPLDPLNPTGPSRPLDPEEDGRRAAPPFFIPIPIPTQPFNPPGFQTPNVPVSIPVNFRQPATTPTGDPLQLINPTVTPTPNPNTSLQPSPVPQPVRIEEGNCCIPPANPEIMKALERIKQGIGVDGLPASVPTQIAQKNTGQRSIASLAELQIWAVQQLDGVAGQWPIDIGVDTPGGNVGLSIPNMAEAIAEQMGLLIGQQVTSAQILNTTSRTLAQAGSATQQAHLAHLTAKANADFLGYESRANAVDIPLAYTPGLSPFDGLLNESTAKIQGFQNTDGTDIKAIFAELLQAAAIIRAVYWRKLDPKGDLKTQIRQNIRGQSDFIDEAAAGGGDDSDWEAYLRQVAEGFRGVTGDANPYNRPPAEGPEIKDRSPGEGNT